MHTNWHKFLEQRFSNRNSALENPIGNVSTLPPVGILEVTGKDAATFLQGQATCDVLKIGSDDSCLGAFCNVQGRVISIFRIWRQEEGFQLLLANDLLPVTLKRLQMYVLRADVQLQAKPDLCLFGIDSPQPPSFLNLPGRPNQISRGGGLSSILLPFSSYRFLAIGDLEAAKNCWLRLADGEHYCQQPATYWQLQDIRSGLPQISTETTEQFLPQMLNLDLLGGISFEKGCYTGQEVIARTHYRGTVKRRLYRARLETTETVRPGDSLVQEADKVGQVVTAAPVTKNTWECLAVVLCDRVQKTLTCLNNPNGPPLQWLELAYTS